MLTLHLNPKQRDLVRQALQLYIEEEEPDIDSVSLLKRLRSSPVTLTDEEHIHLRLAIEVERDWCDNPNRDRQDIADTRSLDAVLRKLP